MIHARRRLTAGAVAVLAQAIFLLPMLVLPRHTVSGTTESRPFWTEQAVFHFGEDAFFTGRASCAPTAEEGRQRAYAAALQEIKNYAQVTDVSGVLVDTQMVFEDTHAPDCSSGSVTVWRLLRVPRTALEAIARRARTGLPDDVSPIVRHNRAIRNLTPRVGMLREETWQRYGQPRSVWMNPENGEARWEYPQFGLTLFFDQEDALRRWQLAEPTKVQPPRRSASTTNDERIDSNPDLPAIDLTDRLRDLEERQDRALREQARLYCAVRFPGRQPSAFMQQRAWCEQREYERLKSPHQPR